MGVSPVLDFVRQHKALTAVAAVAATGSLAAMGHRAYAGPRNDDPQAGFVERLENSAREIRNAGVAGAITGAALWPVGKAYARDAQAMVRHVAATAAPVDAARLGKLNLGPRLSAAFSHGSVGGAVGGAIGAAIAYHASEGDLGSTAMGAGVGLAVGTLGIPLAHRIGHNWSALGKKGALGKAARLGLGAAITVGVAGLAHALLVPDEYQDEAASIPDTPFESGYGPTLRQRLAAMNGTGDVVLGLHNRR